MGATVVVSGALAAKPGNGGEAWVTMSWVRGLRELGFDCWFVEELPAAHAEHEAWFRLVTERFDLAERAVLMADGGGDGPRRAVVAPAGAPPLPDLVRSAALVVNISGALRDPALLALATVSAYVDLDPGFTQVWAETGAGDLGLDRHDLHFTVGLGIGTAGSPLPTGGVRWHHCHQPFLEADWPESPVPDDGVFTTVASWRCPFGRIEWDGVTYGLKLHEFRRVIQVPSLSGASPELALSIDSADDLDRIRLVEHGWNIRPAPDVAATPDAFAGYVRGSLAEFTAAQGVYVHGRTGWFSDRTVRYLASGRPAVVQDTGLAGLIPLGEGLIVFNDAASAASALRRVERDPQRHGRAAARLAREHFAATKVLGAFVEVCGVAP